MTSLTVLGSGSSGNAAILEHEGHLLLLDAGFSAREIERRAQGARLDLERLAGIAITHEHNDHAQGAERLARKYGVPVLASAGTWWALRRGIPESERVRFQAVSGAGRAECGPFTVTGCALLHDAAEPLALTVTVADGISVGVAYDFGKPTQGLRYHFRRVNALLLESNYDEVMLRTSDYPASVQQRIAGSGGHLSNRACAELLRELWHPGLVTVVLAHLSRRCNSPAAARAVVEPALRARGFSGVLEVASQETPLHPIRLSAGRFSPAEANRDQGELPLQAAGASRDPPGAA